MGKYTDNVTFLGTIGEIGIGFFGLDAPADFRDLCHDFEYWEYSWSHAGETTLDAIGFLPVVGIIKYSDEVGAVIKNGDKYEVKKIIDIEKGAAEAIEEAVRLSKYEEMSSGAVKGMFSKMSVNEWLRLEDLAETMYNSFRTRVDDIAKISKNIGLDEKTITQIKNHLFNEEHLFDNGTKRLFDANYWQAEAWERLINGTATETDKLLLNHELFESNYIKAHNCTYEVAHEEANKLYNWSKEVFGE